MKRYVLLTIVTAVAVLAALGAAAWADPPAMRIGTNVVSSLSIRAARSVIAARQVRLEGHPCRTSAGCPEQPMYKPRTFQLGSHYWFSNVKWTNWNRFAAAATLTLHAEFAGMAHPTAHRTTVVFERVKTLCGVLTFTRWVSGDGNAQDFARVPGAHACMWYLGAP